MPDDLLNPYAPPVAAEPQAPSESERLWMVHGNHLLVRDGARIPPVSLYGEDDSKGLTSSHQVFAIASGNSMLLLLLSGVITGVVMFLTAIGTGRPPILEGAVTFFICSRLARRFKKAGPSIANVHCHLSLSALKARARRDSWRSTMTMTALTAIFVLLLGDIIEKEYILGDDGREYWWSVGFILPVSSIMLAGFIGAVLWQAMERGLRCVSQTGGWFYLAGVPASSLLKLAAMSPESPPVRPRKVYSLYQYRLPLAILLGPRRNPLLVLIIAIMKVTRSPAFVRRSFHWSEGSRDVEPDKELAERIEKLRASVPEFADWQDMGCKRLDSPLGEVRVLTVQLVSPDRQHICIVTLVWLSKARAFVEVFQTSFRTWTTDGRCLITSDQPSFPCLPAYVDFQKVKGGHARLWSSHLRRCEQVTTKTMEDEGELKRLLEKEAEDHSRLLEAAGVHGPVEEVDLPGDWGDWEDAAPAR